MRSLVVVASCLLVAGSVLAATPSSVAPARIAASSPIFGVTIPDGYRQWELVGVAHETDPLNELRSVVGNAPAMQAYRTGALPFPDGTVLVKLAWKHTQSEEFAPAFVPGAATTIQVMVKDSKKYAATGGWGFGRFVNGEPADAAQHQACFACHSANVRDHDFVFTRFAPKVRLRTELLESGQTALGPSRRDGAHRCRSVERGGSSKAERNAP